VRPANSNRRSGYSLVHVLSSSSSILAAKSCPPHSCEPSESLLRVALAVFRSRSCACRVLLSSFSTSLSVLADLRGGSLGDAFPASDTIESSVLCQLASHYTRSVVTFRSKLIGFRLRSDSVLDNTSARSCQSGTWAMGQVGSPVLTTCRSVEHFVGTCVDRCPPIVSLALRRSCKPRHDIHWISLACTARSILVAVRFGTTSEGCDFVGQRLAHIGSATQDPRR
jgi:hypothetical protein